MVEVISIIIASTLIGVLFIGESWRKKGNRERYLERLELRKLLDVEPMEIDNDPMDVDAPQVEYYYPVVKTYLDKTHKNNIKYE